MKITSGANVMDFIWERGMDCKIEHDNMSSAVSFFFRASVALSYTSEMDDSKESMNLIRILCGAFFVMRDATKRVDQTATERGREKEREWNG